jgi:hypothetical protein
MGRGEKQLLFPPSHFKLMPVFRACLNFGFASEIKFKHALRLISGNKPKNSSYLDACIRSYVGLDCTLRL